MNSQSFSGGKKLKQEFSRNVLESSCEPLAAGPAQIWCGKDRRYEICISDI